MSIIRQDAWSNDEDLVLAEVVLRHIREGSTQLSAFEEVGERLSRTAAACGFKWNSSIRKKYEAAIAIAKKQRKSLKKTKSDDDNHYPALEIARQEPVAIESNQVPEQIAHKPQISLDDVITFLTIHKDTLSSNNKIVEGTSELKEKVDQLTNDNEKLSKAFTLLQENYNMMKQDYQMLIDIMDRAKQMSVAKG